MPRNLWVWAAAKARPFVEAYFGAWVVRFLTAIVVLALTILAFEAFVTTFGPVGIANAGWFPLTQHIPSGWGPWMLVFMLFVISLAIAQHVAQRLNIGSAEHGKAMAEEKLRYKHLENTLDAERSKAELLAVQQRPLDAIKKQYDQVLAERTELRRKIAELQAADAVTDEERMGLAKGHLRKPIDGLAHIFALNTGQLETARAMRGPVEDAIAAGQLVLRHASQNKWHQMLRVPDVDVVEKNMAGLHAFIDELTIEMVKPSLTAEDLAPPSAPDLPF